MVVERVGRCVGSGEHLDVEPFEQRTRAEFGRAQLLPDLIVDPRRSVARQLVVQPEHLVQLVIEPRASRCAPKQVVMVREPLPHLARVRLDWSAVSAWDA